MGLASGSVTETNVLMAEWDTADGRAVNKAPFKPFGSALREMAPDCLCHCSSMNNETAN